MKRAIAIAIALALVMLAGIGCGGSTERAEPQQADADTAAAERAAVAAAEEWLGLVDQGQYAASWDEAAALFRQAVPRARWETTVESVRAPLGKLLSRQLRDATFRTSLPGAPAGQYVVIRFAADFDGGKSAIETITPRLEDDGTWRVSGYFIK